MSKLVISPTVYQHAQASALPAYFFEGRIGLACNSQEATSVHWTNFVEAFIIDDRILVIHRQAEPSSWAISDFITGVRLLEEHTRKTIIDQKRNLTGRLEPLTGFSQINTKSFSDAYLQIVKLIQSTTGVARLGLLCACRDIAADIIEY